ncbi:duf1765 domain containing protein, partial [Cystoisospora suis]
MVPPEIVKIADLHKSLLDLLFSKAQHSPQEVLLSFGIGGYLVGAVVGGVVQKSKNLAHPFTSSSNVSLSSSPPSQPSALPGGTTKAGGGGALPPTALLSDAKKEQVSTEFQVVCEQLLVLLSMTEAETRRSFIYSSEEALVTAQNVLLSLGNHILEYTDYVLWQHRGLYCSLLHHVLRRGELDIGTVLPPPATCVLNNASALAPGYTLDLHDLYILYRFMKRSTAGVAGGGGHSLPSGLKGGRGVPFKRKGGKGGGGVGDTSSSSLMGRRGSSSSFDVVDDLPPSETPFSSSHPSIFKERGLSPPMGVHTRDLSSPGPGKEGGDRAASSSLLNVGGLPPKGSPPGVTSTPALANSPQPAAQSSLGGG